MQTGIPGSRDRHGRVAVGDFAASDHTLTPAQRRYIRVETVIAAVINAVLSLIFVWLVFGGRLRVPAFGTDGLVLDAVPQTLMVTLMSALVPGLLTRKRLRAGTVEGAAPPTVAAVVLRAVGVAALAAGVLTGLHYLLLARGPSDYGFGTVLIAKMLYGALLGAIVSRRIVRAMLVGRRA